MAVVHAVVQAAALALAAAAAQAQPQVPQPAPGPEACTACHGPGGNSQVATMPSIAAQPRTFLENQLVLIREGLRDVPAMKAVMGSLSDEQIVALAKHFSALPALPAVAALSALAAPGEPQPAKLRAGAALSQRGLCGSCHLPGYVGQSQVPRLAGQQEAYLATTLKMYRDAPDPGRDTAMSGVLRGLQDADLANLAHYFAHAK